MSKNRKQAQPSVKSAAKTGYSSRSQAVDAYIRRVQSFGPDQVMRERLDAERAKRRPA